MTEGELTNWINKYFLDKGKPFIKATVKQAVIRISSEDKEFKFGTTISPHKDELIEFIKGHIESQE